MAGKMEFTGLGEDEDNPAILNPLPSQSQPQPTWSDLFRAGLRDAPDEVKRQFLSAYHQFSSDSRPSALSLLFPAIAGSRAIGDVGNMLFSPVSGTTTSAIGMPVEKKTGIPRQITGNAAALLATLPLGMEAEGAKAGSLLSDESGVFGSRSASSFPKNVTPWNKMVDLAHEGGLPNTKLSDGPDEGIFNTHGWFPTEDASPRFEIPDKGIMIDQSKFNKTPVSGTFHLGPTKNPETGEWEYSNPTLGELLPHPELYKAYPFLKDIPVKPLPIGNSLSGVKAGYDPETKTMYLGSGGPEELTSNLLHETQHAIDSHEGYQAGGNTNQFIPKPIQDMMSELPEERKYWQDKTGINTYPILLSAVQKAGINSGRGLSYNEAETLRNASHEPWFDDFMSHVDKNLVVEAAKQSAERSYRNLGGETVARAVQDRYMAGQNDMTGIDPVHRAIAERFSQLVPEGFSNINPRGSEQFPWETINKQTPPEKQIWNPSSEGGVSLMQGPYPQGVRYNGMIPKIGSVDSIQREIVELEKEEAVDNLNDKGAQRLAQLRFLVKPRGQPSGPFQPLMSVK